MMSLEYSIYRLDYCCCWAGLLCNKLRLIVRMRVLSRSIFRADQLLLLLFFPAHFDGFLIVTQPALHHWTNLFWLDLFCTQWLDLFCTQFCLCGARRHRIACFSQCVSKCIALPQLILLLYITMLACRPHLQQTIPAITSLVIITDYSCN